MKPLTKEKQGVLIKNDMEKLSEHVDWNFHFICYINWVLVQSGMSWEMHLYNFFFGID